MNIIVCVKEIPDPETPASAFAIDEAAMRAIPAKDTPPVISPFDEQAVEAALRLKDSLGAKVTVLSMGASSAEKVLKHTLSMGADEAFLLSDSSFENSDSTSAAYTLAQAIKKVGEYDMIICGRQAGDFDSGQVGSGIAEMLGIPSVTVAKKIETLDGKAKVERVLPDGYEVVEVSLPALITVSNELGEPRYATLKGIMAAAKKTVPVWNAAEIGADVASIGTEGRKTKMLKLFIPVRESKCEFIEGENEEETAVKLAQKLREVKLI
ncbi:MAG: electron transfer flavoprotein subunit beta/FixA family protein [Dehalococcoidia bacterium]|nr:MAG: electron transfer flavoprotein subunit beta/FixA family protein [Dehalococcoidia bacterium]